MRKEAAISLILAFSHVPDKQKAWDDLIKLANDENIGVRRKAVTALESSITHVPNKQKVWDNLVNLINNGYKDIRCWVIPTLGSVFSHMPDKQKAWDFLIRLADDEDIDSKREIISVLSYSFSHVPDKQKAWNDLHRLANDRDSYVRREVASTLVFAFAYIPDKQLMWNDLHRFTTDESSDVRCRTASVFNSVFSYFPNKQKAWDDLHRLVNDESIDVRCRATSALGYAFLHVPNKQLVWYDLQKLITDENRDVRCRAVSALSFVFPYLLDKELALNSLRGLVNDGDNFVRIELSFALGCVFPHAPDKQLIYNDLNILARDEDSDVISYANHSLGKVSIIRASQAEKEEDYKKELEKAIAFFAKATQDSSYLSPSQFCLPFYRSFYSIIFKRHEEAKREIEIYLAEAKTAIEGSKSKELLLKTVENLAYALKKVHNLENLDLQAKKDELNSYRKHCENAAELMKNIEDTAPYATTAINKGLPILDRNLKGLIDKIQKKAEIACKESRGTEAEEIVYEINTEIQNTIVDYQRQYIESTKIFENILSIVKMRIPQVCENEFICHLIEEIDNSKMNNAEKYCPLPLIISMMPTMKVVSEQELKLQLERQLDPIHNTLDNVYDNTNLIVNEIVNVKDKLSCISFDISKIKMNLAEVVSNLKTMKEELEKLDRIEGLNALSIEKLSSSQAEKLKDLNNNILGLLNEIKTLIDRLPKNDDTQKFYTKLNELKESKPEILFQKSVDVIGIIGFAMQLYQQFGPV